MDFWDKVASNFAHLLEMFTVYLFVAVVFLQHVWGNVYSFFSNPMNVIALYSIALTTFIVLKVIDRRKRIRGYFAKIYRGANMSPQDRALHVKRVLADAITDAIFEAVMDGKITLDEGFSWSDKLADHYGLKELSSRKKDRIKENLRKSIGSKGNPAPIPDEAAVVKPSRFRMGKIFGKKSQAA